MANTVITYPAQKLTIKAMRGHHFKLVINVKDSNGNNYDFTSNPNDSTDPDTARIVVVRPDGEDVINSPGDEEVLNPGLTLSAYIAGTAEDGKLTFEWNSPNAFAPWPGKYKYHIYTRDNTEDTDTHIWLYGDFIVVDSMPSALSAQVTN
jgi:hypothetical protein